MMKISSKILVPKLLLTHIDVLPNRFITKGNATLMLITFIQKPYMEEAMLELITKTLKGKLDLINEEVF